MRTKREFLEDFILARATSDKMNMNSDTAKAYVESAEAFWDAIESRMKSSATR